MRRGPLRPESTPVGFVRKPRIADEMTRELDSFLDSSLAAEQAGDARSALEFHLGIPMFRRSRHRYLLQQLVGLESEMTPWIWARWAAYQASRTEGRHECGDVVRSALLYTTEMFYPDLMEDAFVQGEDPIRILSRLMGESWIFHQVCTFELGALELFLDNVATGDLAAHGEIARSWVDCPMGGYRLDSAGGELVAVDARSGERRPLLDLGADLHAGNGGHVVGRLVPSGATPGWMFDTRPVPVDEMTAQQVARDPSARGWILALKAGIDQGRVQRDRLESEDRELVSDVPALRLLEEGTPATDLDGARRRLVDGRDEIGRSSYRIVRRVAEGLDVPGPRGACLAAAILNPHAHAETWRQLAATTTPERWTAWANRVPEPARGRLLRLAAATQAA